MIKESKIKRVEIAGGWIKEGRHDDTEDGYNLYIGKDEFARLDRRVVHHLGRMGTLVLELVDEVEIPSIGKDNDKIKDKVKIGENWLEVIIGSKGIRQRMTIDAKEMLTLIKEWEKKPVREVAFFDEGDSCIECQFIKEGGIKKAWFFVPKGTGRETLFILLEDFRNGVNAFT